MDPVSALGLACNVMQIISFCHETITLCKRLHKDGSSDPNLDHVTSHLSHLSNNLRDSIDAAKQGVPLKQQEKELQSIANECYKASTALQLELAKVANVSVGSHRSAIKATLKTVWRKSNLEKLEKTMNTNQRLLESKLLEQLYINVIGTKNDVQQLDQSSKYFIEQYSQGRRQISQLILDQGALVKAHVTKETERLREDLERRFDEQKLVSINKDLIARVVGSLKDNATNLRRNQVTESYDGTFEWIFDEEIKRPWDCFVKWLTSESNLYWINGKPGSGKSTLMKFLISETRTQDALNKWHPECVILSAFLWKPGQEIQRSLKGLLSSLTYQFLNGQPSKVLDIVSVHPDILNKTHLSDWSVAELDGTLIDLLTRSNDFTCIFVDGLDEIGSENDVHDLVELMEKWRCHPKVKVCVSSRPERPFQLAFDRYPKLRLQDLTAADIQNYITSFLQPQTKLLARNNYPDDAIRRLSDLIAKKADGVFLWVHLVLRSVRTGFTNADDWHELIRRLQLLHGNLHELYNQMWQRLNEDEPLYRNEAAICFNTVMNSHHIPSTFATISTISMVLHPSIVNTIIHSRSRVSPDRIAGLCHQTANRIHSRSAGLLEIRISDDVSTDIDRILHDLSTRDQLNKLVKMNVNFIHRTAVDFLLDTEEGKEILKHDKISVEDQCVRALEAAAAQVVILHDVSTNTSVNPHINGFLGVLSAHAYFMSETDESHKKWQDMLILCQDLFNHNVLVSPRSSPDDFIGLAASYGFDLFVIKALKEIKEKYGVPRAYENYILSCVSFKNGNFLLFGMDWIAWDAMIKFDAKEYSNHQQHALHRVKNLINWLLECGADPNATLNKATDSLRENTPFMTFLRSARGESSHLGREKYDVSQRWFFSLAGSFIESGANLNSISFRFHLKYFDAESLTHLRHAIYNQYRIPVFLSEINAAYLIQELLEHCDFKDSEIESSFIHLRIIEATKRNRVILAGWVRWDTVGAPEPVFEGLVVVTEMDSIYLTSLFKGDWRNDPGSKNPFENHEFQGILQRGRQVSFDKFMEEAGIFLPGSTEESYPPRLPGTSLTDHYSAKDVHDMLEAGLELPQHTWFRD